VNQAAFHPAYGRMPVLLVPPVNWDGMSLIERSMSKVNLTVGGAMDYDAIETRITI
jgi:hypothetical protein